MESAEEASGIQKSPALEHREQAKLGKGKHRQPEAGRLGLGKERLKGNRESCALSDYQQGRTVKLKEKPMVAKSSKD